MLRRALSCAVALLLTAGLSAEEKKKPAAVAGAFESFADGKLTVAVKGKKNEPATKKEFKLADDLKVTVLAGEEKNEVVAKEAFKDAKAGTLVSVTLGEGDKVTAVSIGTGKKKKEK